MRTPFLIFSIGLIISFGGIILAISLPTTDPWRLRSEILASERPLAVSPASNSKMEVLANEESLSTSPLWLSENEILLDEVITADYSASPYYPPYTYYGYSSGQTYVVYEAKDILVAGTAIEQSSPQREFNFYIFDESNLRLWGEGELPVTHVAYYEVRGKTSVSFDFSIATKDDLPGRFYFVVEEYVEGVTPTVHVSSTIDWVEKSPRYDYTDYFLAYGPFTIEKTKDFVLNGSAIETGGYRFNFYIMDFANYYDWYDEESYTAYFELKDVSTTTFSVPLTEDQATSSFYFAIENPNLDTDEIVNLSATINWIKESSLYDRSEYFHSLKDVTMSGRKDFILRGTATEIDSNQFNFYIFDSSNYFDWRGNDTYSSYYEAKNVTTTSFSIPLTNDESAPRFYFVVENSLPDLNETVKLSATLEWNEKATIVEAAGGKILGGTVAFLGFVVMNIAGVERGIRVAEITLGILSVIGGFVPIGLATYMVFSYIFLGGWAAFPSEWSTGTSLYFVLFFALCLFAGGASLLGYGSKLLGHIRSPASKARQRAEKYKKALKYLDSCTRFTYKDLAKTNSIVGNVMSESELRRMWDMSKRTLEGAKGVKQTFRNLLIEGIAAFESVAKKLEKR